MARQRCGMLRLVLVLVWVLVMVDFTRAQGHQMRSDWALPENEYVLAFVNVTYRDPRTDEVFYQSGEIGKYSSGLVAVARGRLVHVRTRNGTDHTGCPRLWENELPSEPWVALVQRGPCHFDVQLENAFRANASGLVVYDRKEGGHLQRMHLSSPHRNSLVAVFIRKAQGEDLAAVVDQGVDIFIQLTPGKHFTFSVTSLNKTSVLFVSVSFILLMIISLAWLLFYYVQRFRYMHAKDLLARRLVSAARKALSRIPVRALKTDDPLGEAECCAVCLEPYRAGEHVRLLPCSHEFHKACVDPWLLKNRSCPMCKMDILKFYGLAVAPDEGAPHLESAADSSRSDPEPLEVGLQPAATAVSVETLRKFSRSGRHRR